MISLLLVAPAGHAAEHSAPARLAARSLLLGLARAGDTVVAVGDRGHVLRSTDEGRSWTQVGVPTRAMLTAVSFADPTHGWAVGHDGVILATADGGKSWHRQDSGTDLETVWLDVLFLDARHGFVVGAYGRALVTTDGGKSWQPMRPVEDELHYNRLVATPGGRLYLAGEAGLLVTSTDQGATWQRLEVPYDGSLFTILPLGGRSVAVAGMRGRLLVSGDNGATWTDRSPTLPALLAAGTLLQGDVAVVGGQGGHLFVSRDGGTTFAHWKPAESNTGLSALLPSRDGALLAAGEAGAIRLPLP